ncbi:hypothetical protein EYZ11_013296 [Aspergillus tanneri]|uniref:Uncharacterized protein n=1 Tax=Aspergillus tanneri TaxID=1220188 RepID=A0A4S3IY10_9EURO|nr:hypothetical protein EYZ11_013296 [Aspergillus tanneri]
MCTDVHTRGIFAGRDRFLQALHIDEIVCAELPNPADDPELYELVKTHMIHNPCGPGFNAKAPC